MSKTDDSNPENPASPYGLWPYGSCPLCYSPGYSRERRPNGNDRCIRGHTYPSAQALPSKAPEAKAPEAVESKALTFAILSNELEGILRRLTELEQKVGILPPSTPREDAK